MNWIQNGNQSRSTSQSLTVIITSSLMTLYSITLHSFDAVEESVVGKKKKIVEILYRRCAPGLPTNITMKTLILGAQV